MIPVILSVFKGLSDYMDGQVGDTVKTDLD